MTSRLLVLLAASALSGCTVVSYNDGESSFKSATVGTNTKIQRLLVTKFPDGRKELSLEGYVQNQTEVVTAVTEGAVRSVIPTRF